MSASHGTGVVTQLLVIFVVYTILELAGAFETGLVRADSPTIRKKPTKGSRSLLKGTAQRTHTPKSLERSN